MARYSLEAKRRNADNERRKRKNTKRRLRDETSREDRLREKRFLCWDGEGYDDDSGQHHYMLFGNSDGDEIHGESLGTSECLDLILEAEANDPDAIHVGFAFEYDVNMILKDLSWRHLAVLHDSGRTTWNGYTITHVPHKIFGVSKGKVHATIYDVFGFFHSSYVAALEKYGIGDRTTLDTIKSGKKRRGTFRLEEMGDIIKYWSTELSLMPDLMGRIREAAFGGGFYISEWHGPGALASYALRYHKANDWHMSKEAPAAVKGAVQAAYAGGRFQAFYCGEYDGPVYTADINSAYIYACSLLRRLDNGNWRRWKDDEDIEDFALYRVEFDATSMMSRNLARKRGVPLPPFPLFHRSAEGILSWPERTRGWYWGPEIKAAIEAYPGCAKVREGWVYEHDNTLPFQWVYDSYARRVELQHQGNPAQAAYKWSLASMYGAFARRVGWDRKHKRPPRSHELAWAGFITSYCRAMVFRVGFQCARNMALVSIDTDGITSLVPFDWELENGVGEGLGQWKLEEFDGMLYWQNGIYWMRQNGEWMGPKTRGISKGSISIGAARHGLADSSYNVRPIRHAYMVVRSTRFIGYTQALQGRFKDWRRWKTIEAKVILGGQGKGFHDPYGCRLCRGADDSVRMHTITAIGPDSVVSAPHRLPWMVPDPIRREPVLTYIWKDDELGFD